MRYETKNFQEVKLERTTGMEQNFQLGQNLNLKSPKTTSPQNQIKENMIFETMEKLHTGYFTSDNEPDGIENVTHITFPKKTGY
jgi:hypothetical protein